MKKYTVHIIWLVIALVALGGGFYWGKASSYGFAGIVRGRGHARFFYAPVRGSGRRRYGRRGHCGRDCHGDR